MIKKYLLIFFISMVPLIELRGAIPTAVTMDLDYLTSMVVCCVGNMLPVPIIYLFARQVLHWARTSPASAPSSASAWTRVSGAAKSCGPRLAVAACSWR